MNDTRRQREAALFLATLNDLKRNDEVAAREIGIDLVELRSYLRAEADIPRALKAHVAGLWPISVRDLEVVTDDAPTGVRIMRARESEQSERILERGGVPYYAYRDTAMSRTAPFRPEWIAELVTVDGADPDDPAVQWNNGHLLWQFTYFIGPVNFYYMEDGQRRVAAMSTGDSMHIAPFVPHSFTTRRTPEGTRGLILALTYGGRLLGDGQQELSVLGYERAEYTSLPETVGRRALGILLRWRMEEAMCIPGDLGRRIGMDPNRIRNIMDGAQATYDELRLLAGGLGANIRDLLGYDLEEPDVVVCHTAESEETHRLYEKYVVRDLAHTSRMPETHAFVMGVSAVARSKSSEDLLVGLHQYGYVLDGAVNLHWQSDDQSYLERLEAGDSFTMKPTTEHGFTSESVQSTILLLRVAGVFTGDARLELSILDGDCLRRAVGETTQWYDPAGGRGTADHNNANEQPGKGDT